MSNLGAYQWITTVSKKVGGPINLMAINILSGYVGIRTVEAIVRTIIKKVKEKQITENDAMNIQVLTVKNESTSNEGVVFKNGDKIIILEKDKDTVLVVKIDDEKSPYFVSKDFICKIIA